MPIPRLTIALACMLACAAPGASSAASAERQQPPPQAQRKLDELSEVLVEGTRQRDKRPGFKQYEQDFGWLARMVGTFVIDGGVDLRAQGLHEDQRQVTGRAVCLGFGAAPGVQCELKLRVPDVADDALPAAAAGLDSTSALFGFDLARSGIAYVLVDSKGIAETTVGAMVTADTMQSHARCGLAGGNCNRISTFTAHPDLKTVDLNMDVEVDGVKAAAFTLVLHRVPGRPSVVYGREPQKARKK